MLTTWKAGSVIRNRRTNQAFLVIHVYTHIATMLSDFRNPTPIILLEKDYQDYAKDDDMKMTTKKNDNLDEEIDFEFSPLSV